MTKTGALKYECFTKDSEAIFRIVDIRTQTGIRVRGMTEETRMCFYRLLCDNKVYPEHLLAAAEDYLLGLIRPE